ncbi:MAG: Fic family protein [Sediminibacterium sp. Gen4]|jgi:Fic family protein|uniref:Fic family protein n=1 Tax=unclassified Sediminibacterium TaxID=2635961 RepID=UPI0015BDA291|nr:MULTISPECIES: Fic family protein [unclassified Sediminibacterium]MBW0160077.1 Fic family protein [Sediminibacterium sp.]MBW0165159.1 Fic family protein [Sediminibacterium sp.]MDZ4073031.1 Fic family protein [Sediminibacterium sp.]NWK64613.1 Fic family protein [Sediminibacterium sp. Gen4]
MKPPYNITGEIVRLVSEISHKIGEVNASFLTKQSPELRKTNRIRTIQASLAVEGNTLSVGQITAIIENKKVLGPSKDIQEVTNAIEVYNQLNKLNPFSEKSFLLAHKILMSGLIKNSGKYRTSGVGIVKGSHLAHLAPPASNVSFLMKDLFTYLKKSDELMLIKSCVFHYEMEFIHPFSDGNGRMGRLWQTLLLMNEYPLFEFLPFETLISKNQKKYYHALSTSDKQGNSTFFIVFMLTILSESLDELLAERPGPLSSADRIRIFLSNGIQEFTRKDYLGYFKTISSATASRDLAMAVKDRLIKRIGDKNKTVYQIKDTLTHN